MAGIELRSKTENTSPTGSEWIYTQDPTGAFAVKKMKLSNAISYHAVNNYSTSFSVTVGAGGDYATINAALQALTTKFPIYKSRGVRATITLRSGFVMAEQVLVSGIDLSWITITGVDAETMIQRSALTVQMDSQFPAFGVRQGGKLPTINQLFNMDTSGTATNRHGIFANIGSYVYVAGGKGVRNAGGSGIYTINSTVIVSSSNFSGANLGIVIIGGSFAATNANFSNSGGTGISAFRGAVLDIGSVNVSGATAKGGFFTQGCLIEAQLANFANAGGSGVILTSSFGNFREANLSGAGGTAGLYLALGSFCNAFQVNIQNATQHAAFISDGSHANLSNAVLENCGAAYSHIYVYRGSIVNADAVVMTGTGTGLSQAKNTITLNGIIFQP